jgi:hypothetical protein
VAQFAKLRLRQSHKLVTSGTSSMKVRFALGLISLFVSLTTSADYKSKTCPDCWLPSANGPTVSEGLGVNIHFIDPQAGELKMIADAGFHWVRMDFIWEITERDRGHYDFSAYDRLLKALESFNIRPLFILDYGNPLYTNGKSVRTTEARQGFARWAAAAAKHFAGRGVIWEMFNEPNAPVFWPPEPKVDEYIALASEVGRAFRAAAPNERLIGPATLGFELGFLESCFRAGLLNSWSGVSVHPYRQTNPESAASDYAGLREMIERFRNGSRSDRPIPVIAGEWGYSSVWRGMTEEKQAIMLARQLLTNVANGIPLSIWYDWRDDGQDPVSVEHHFGLVRNKYQTERTQVYEPKPAYFAARTLNNQLGDFRFLERLVVGSADDYILVFGKDGDRRIVAWTTSPTAHRVNIPGMSGRFALTKVTGESAGELSTNPALSVEISPAPIYLAPEN